MKHFWFNIPKKKNLYLLKRVRLSQERNRSRVKFPILSKNGSVLECFFRDSPNNETVLGYFWEIWARTDPHSSTFEKSTPERFRTDPSCAEGRNILFWLIIHSTSERIRTDISRARVQNKIFWLSSDERKCSFLQKYFLPSRWWKKSIFFPL